jgi:hypothetical protein
LTGEPGRRGSLPVPLTSFVGREREIADVREVLRHSRLVTLTGPGGVGKTRLAIEAARRRRVRSFEMVAFADLGPVGERAAVAGAVADAIGLAAASPGMAASALGDWLAGQSLLIVLDNCEHVVGACAELVAGLLGRCPGLRVLATSRESLGVPGEAVWTVAPLSLEESRRGRAPASLTATPPAIPWRSTPGSPRRRPAALRRRHRGLPRLTSAVMLVCGWWHVPAPLVDRIEVVTLAHQVLEPQLAVPPQAEQPRYVLGRVYTAVTRPPLGDSVAPTK